MDPTLTWIDLTSRDRDRMRRLIDLLGEQGILDELGLGTLRDGLADALFPGTSSIQTRLRYVLFIPWIYRALEQRRVSSNEVAGLARRAELDLIAPLLANDDTAGVIGSRARDTLARLPSSVFWSALVRWGIFMPGRSGSWYHANFAKLTRSGDEVARADDPGVVWTRKATWHPRLPEPPDGFPARAGFDLTKAEADFLRGRIEERCAGSLLAWLAREGDPAPAAQFWDDPDVLRAPPQIRALVELARRFSRHVEGPPLLYNVMVAERKREVTGNDDGKVASCRQALSEWSALEKQEAPIDPTVLWAFAHANGVRVSDRQREFINGWSHRIALVDQDDIGDDGVLRALVEKREIEIKPGRARLARGNTSRLLAWTDPVGVGRMDFRWFRVRQVLADLHRP